MRVVGSFFDVLASDMSLDNHERTQIWNRKCFLCTLSNNYRMVLRAVK